MEDSLKDVGTAKIVVSHNTTTSSKQKEREKTPSRSTERSNFGSNKRTASDLFGDIDDIDFNDDFGTYTSYFLYHCCEKCYQQIFTFSTDTIITSTSQKRQKINTPMEDRDAITIAKILERRKRATNISQTNHDKTALVFFSTFCILSP